MSWRHSRLKGNEHPLDLFLRFETKGFAHWQGVAHRPHSGRLPRLARLMALALRCEELLRSGQVKNLAELARLGHVSRARISQIMTLLQLAPDLQEELLFRSRPARGRDPWHLRLLLPIAAALCWREQRRRWKQLPTR